MKSKVCLINPRGLTRSIRSRFQIWKHITFQWVIMLRNFGDFGRKVTKSTVVRLYDCIYITTCYCKVCAYERSLEGLQLNNLGCDLRLSKVTQQDMSRSRDLNGWTDSNYICSPTKNSHGRKLTEMKMKLPYQISPPKNPRKTKVASQHNLFYFK